MVVDDGVTEMAAVVWLPFHRYVPPEVVRVALLPAHIVPSLAVTPNVSVALIEGVGSAFTVTDREADAEHILTSVTVTV